MQYVQAWALRTNRLKHVRERLSLSFTPAIYSSKLLFLWHLFFDRKKEIWRRWKERLDLQWTTSTSTLKILFLKRSTILRSLLLLCFTFHHSGWLLYIIYIHKHYKHWCPLVPTSKCHKCDIWPSSIIIFNYPHFWTSQLKLLGFFSHWPWRIRFIDRWWWMMMEIISYTRITSFLQHQPVTRSSSFHRRNLTERNFDNELWIDGYGL